MAAPKNITTGEVFGRLTVICEAAKLPKNPHRRVTARCECGSLKDYLMSSLRIGHTQSCGCFFAEQKEPHGHAKIASPTYQSWSSMKNRCDPDNGKTTYAGKGIKVCDEWSDFETFLRDMGERPPRTTLDRFPDNKGDYMPGNCRWATPSQQANNRANANLITAQGKTMTVMEWSKETGIPFQTIRHRILRNWPPERAVTPNQ